MYRIALVLTAMLAVLAGLVIGTLNAQAVSLDLLWFSLDWPLGLVVLAALSLGLLIGIGLTWLFAVLPERVRRRARQRSRTMAANDWQEPPNA
jgi:uncharacterized integral membrane protein